MSTTTITARTVRVGDDVDMVPSISQALAYADAVEIVVEPGTYVEQVTVGPRRAPLTIRSTTGRADDVIVTFGLRQGDRGADGLPVGQDCATLTVDADDVTLVGISVEASFDRALHPDAHDTQAIALRTRGDRFTAMRCRFVGRQDTVLLDAPSSAAVRRAHLLHCEIEGDVDIVYGRATALIEGGCVRSAGPGHVAAPSTARENPRGFLFWRVALVGDAPRGSVGLGRPWHPGGDVDAVGQAIFARCDLDAHISGEPWSDMGGFAWRDARFAEYRNEGPGAVRALPPPASDEPDPVTWLSGWTPASDSPAAPRIVITSDSTASEYPPERAPRTGWGQRLSAHTGCDVRNLAISGASSRSFIELGALDRALDLLRPGDLLLIAFGHNDPKDDHRFSDVFTQYAANLRRYLVGARARGARRRC